MEQQIEADSPLDYIDFRISPPNNYDVFICCGEVEDKVGCSPTEQILAYLSPTGSLLEQSHDNMLLRLPEDLGDNTWFTKATLMRLLKMIDSPDALKKMVALNNEISQLEETRGFHLSLYSQAEKQVQSSDDSKNELLRAMNLRLKALREELTTTVNQAAEEVCSHKEMEGLKKFSEHFGHSTLRNTFCKLLVSSQNSKVGDSLDCKEHTMMRQTQSNPVNMTTGDTKILLPSNLDQPIKYNACPAKAAQAERMSSTDSEEFSNSSEEESQPSTERSRSLTRSATPRRSASPMRRVQIGKSGPRRTPAIAIKSLSYFPGRFPSRDTGDEDDDNEEVGSERASKVAQSNVRRMSVQDAISLFEKKQKDQSTTDVQPKKSQDDKPVKPVLRRWSSGMGESSAQFLDQSTQNKVEACSNGAMDEGETANNAQEIQQERGPATNLSRAGQQAVQTCGHVESGNVGSFLSNHIDVAGSLEEGTNEKLDSAEWNKQKEEELNEMLVKFALCKPTSKYQKIESEDSRKPGSQKRKSGLIQYKDQRGQRLQGDDAEKKTIKQVVKKTDKQGPTKSVQKSFDRTAKNETSFTNVTGVAKKQASVVAQKEKVVKRSPLTSNTKRELAQKAPPKPSLPATRKSWPSAHSSVASQTGAIRTPPSINSSGLASSCQKGQLSAPLSRSAPKVEAPQSQRKEARKSKVENKRTPKTMDENKTLLAPKVSKTKAKVISASDEYGPKVPVKPGLRKNVVTKKSSVVPLESKTSNTTPRKASTASPAKGSTPKKRGSPSVKEPPSKPKRPQETPVPKCETLVPDLDDEAIPLRASEPTNQTVEEAETSEIGHVDLEPESHLQVETLGHCGYEEEGLSENPPKCDEKDERIIVETSEAEIQYEEEPIISPTAWVENVKQDIPSSETASELASLTNQADVGSSGSQVRHSLSQMLLEENSESDIIEWGNAENPPSMVFHKDAPKGLKRLLKFSRKSKGEANVAGASPYTSEGEDEGDECKGLGRKNFDNLLKKAALNATHHGQYGISSDGYDKNLADPEPLAARSNASNSSFQSSSSTTSKASRSFFSLSAFRGNKTTDTKLR